MSSGGVGGLESQGSCVQLQPADRAFLRSVTASEYFCAVNVIGCLLRRRRHAAQAHNSDRRRHMSACFISPRSRDWSGALHHGTVSEVSSSGFSVRMTDGQTDRQTEVLNYDHLLYFTSLFYYYSNLKICMYIFPQFRGYEAFSFCLLLF